ncbi:Anaphase-promoting complex subunit 5 [Escovopsis weberi]|uniref:Anaphase-promoting complex subunit 5 n=1 Tax=Escovopsis weberi TaxID=150374 RepID=A0A0M8N7Y0_ESCWE|nr:Anaphase-promoting complex subunit 5 [Escovopsis weberi]
MSRYLTPAKIGLLILIELYVEECFPRDAILPVLSFITSYLIDYDPNGTDSTQSTRWNKAGRAASLVVSIEPFDKLLNAYPLFMGPPGKRPWDLFVSKLWAIDSLYALEEFVASLSRTLSKTKEELRLEGLDPDQPEPGIKLSHNSLFGAFVRRAQVEYVRLRLQDCAELWTHFIRYRQPTAPYQKRRDPDFGRFSFDNVLLTGEASEWAQGEVDNLAAVVYGDMLSENPSSTLPVSTDDIEGLLDFQIEQMQKYGNRVPLDIRRQFHDLLNDSLSSPSLRHYLTYLDAWRGGDYATAFDFLHRYFDYTMQYRDRLFYQYALMNLAVLQADFGCHQEAIAAMLETVATARENRDITCLNFALNWLFHFGRGHVSLIRGLESDSLAGVGKETLSFLRVKAKESGMLTLWSSVLLSEAKLCLANGDSVSTTLEHMTRSSQLIVEKDMRSMLGSQLSLQTSLWSRLGLTHLATVTCEVFLRCYTSFAVFDDELKITSRLSLILLEQGRFGEALETLERADENSLRSWKPRQYWQKYGGVVRLKRNIHHNNLDEAELLLGRLLQTPSEDLEPDMSFIIDSLRIDCLTRRGDLQRAAEIVDRMLSAARDENKDIALQVRLLLLKVSLLDKCGRPQLAFSTAMRAANISFRARLISSLWQAIGAIANILVSMGEFEPAAQLLTAVIPRSLECESPYLSARLYSCLADAYMGLAGQAEPATAAERKERARMRARKQKKSGLGVETTRDDRDEYLARASTAVQKSFDLYEPIEDTCGQCEMMAKKAVIMQLSGDLVLAASYAASYGELRKKAATLELGRAAMLQNT